VWRTEEKRRASGVFPVWIRVKSSIVLPLFYRIDIRDAKLQSIPELPQRSDAQASQALRQRRFYMAAATYGACGIYAQICAWLGYLPAWLPGWWIAGAATANLGLFLAFRTGWNLRFRDPSLTELQLAISNLAVLPLMYYADSARGAFLLLLVVPMLFGVLRLRLFQMARVGLFGVVGYAMLIFLLQRTRPDDMRIDVEMLNLLALTLTMVFVCLLGGYISKVRAELSRSVATIRDMAQRDPLTGVFNRRHLMDTLEREVARCERHGARGMALCVIDLDFFKRINDTCGHPVGDDVLVAVGRCVSESIRGSDYVARYGGEEFVALLEGGSVEAAREVCERIRARIGQLRIGALQGQVLSASIGLAAYEPGDDAGSLLQRADKALYQAKAEGRNCVRVLSLEGIGASLLERATAASNAHTERCTV